MFFYINVSGDGNFFMRVRPGLLDFIGAAGACVAYVMWEAAQVCTVHVGGATGMSQFMWEGPKVCTVHVGSGLSSRSRPRAFDKLNR